MGNVPIRDAWTLDGVLYCPTCADYVGGARLAYETGVMRPAFARHQSNIRRDMTR